MQLGSNFRLTDRKDEAPPSHVEWKPSGKGDHNDSENEPHNSKSPQNQAKHDAYDVKRLAGRIDMRQSVRLGNNILGELS